MAELAAAAAAGCNRRWAEAPGGLWAARRRRAAWPHTQATASGAGALPPLPPRAPAAGKPAALTPRRCKAAPRGASQARASWLLARASKV